MPKQDLFNQSINIQPNFSLVDMNARGDTEQAKEFAEQKAFLETIDKKGSFSGKHLCKFLSDTTGHILFVVIFIVVQLGALFQYFSSRYLLSWAKDFKPEDQWKELGIYALLVTISLVIPVLRRYIMLAWPNRLISIRLHARMLYRMIYAPITNFF